MKKSYLKQNKMILGWALFFFAALVLPVTFNALQDSQKTRASAQSMSSTEFSFTVYLHAIGRSGDTVNPDNSAFSNKSPDRNQRATVVNVYNSSGQLVLSKNDGYVRYNDDKGAYLGVIDMGNTLSSGDYTIKIKIDSYLVRSVPGVQHISAFTQEVMPPITLVAGDFDSNNAINVLDYNFLMGCYSDIMDPAFCDFKKSSIADISDDGHVNQLDYNLFIREISVQHGD